VISQGAEGAIGVGPDGVFKAVPPPIVARSTVGSGDSMVAGLAIALDEGLGLRTGLSLGTAAGAATAAIPGTHLCDGTHVADLQSRVLVKRLATSQVRVTIA
jgi:fructose-1-phosphate kinase PfkB-like protein